MLRTVGIRLAELFSFLPGGLERPLPKGMWTKLRDLSCFIPIVLRASSTHRSCMTHARTYLENMAFTACDEPAGWFLMPLL